MRRSCCCARRMAFYLMLCPLQQDMLLVSGSLCCRDTMHSRALLDLHIDNFAVRSALPSCRACHHLPQLLHALLPVVIGSARRNTSRSRTIISAQASSSSRLTTGTCSLGGWAQPMRWQSSVRHIFPAPPPHCAVILRHRGLWKAFILVVTQVGGKIVLFLAKASLF